MRGIELDRIKADLGLRFLRVRDGEVVGFDMDGRRLVVDGADAETQLTNLAAGDYRFGETVKQEAIAQFCRHVGVEAAVGEPDLLGVVRRFAGPYKIEPRNGKWRASCYDQDGHDVVAVGDTRLEAVRDLAFTLIVAATGLDYFSLSGRRTTS